MVIEIVFYFAIRSVGYSNFLTKMLYILRFCTLALKSVLSAKAAAGEIIVVDSINMDSIKTKAFRGFLDAVKCDGKAVVITPEVNENVVKSARNIPGVLTTTAKILSVYDLVNAKYLVIDQAALATIEEVYA